MDKATPDIVRKVAWMPVKDRRVLFARSHKEKEIFYCVGGKIDVKDDVLESDIEALKREVMEEAGVTLEPKSIRYLNTFIGPCHGYPDTTKLHMYVFDGVADKEPVASAEVAELAWFSSADANRTTDMGRSILQWYKEKGLID